MMCFLFITSNFVLLEMDFVIEGDGKSMHVLNAVSPAFTCSIPFSKYIVDKIEKFINHN